MTKRVTLTLDPLPSTSSGELRGTCSCVDHNGEAAASVERINRKVDLSIVVYLLGSMLNRSSGMIRVTSPDI